ncbi:hypothetical protein FHX37_2763 [Haloactinospora alba]|uniref:CDP-glycerol:poly(Glycerophosphate) glycerophosphotransferase n=1 Tax=Haloactinospora alba TaxID=405555 RepID=A0A543NLS9_9ACTN|nr:hypothetical protein FHX37_2763 [Haloactinospora alba]
MRDSAGKRPTVRASHPVLAVARSVPATDRVLDVLQLFRGDDRVEVTFTVNPGSASGAGVAGMLRDAGVENVIDWEQAVRERDRYRLALAASPKEDLHRLARVPHPGRAGTGHGPPLVLMPHGIGHNRRVPDAGGTPDRASGLDPGQLLHEGRPVPARVALSHREQHERLAAACPEAAERAVVTGDPSHDRMLANLGRRARYRAALGAAEGQVLVVVSSTWNRDSLLGAQRETLRRLLAELPADEYRVALVAHPNVWHQHGRAQLELWLADEIEAGLTLVHPHNGWRAALVAADAVVGDHGSTTYYAAALGRPVLLAAFGNAELDPDSPLRAFGRRTPFLRADRGVPDQVEEVLAAPAPEARGLLIEHPGTAAHRLRDLFYGLLGLRPPQQPARFFAVPEPVATSSDVTAWRVSHATQAGTPAAPPRVRVRRTAAATAAPEAGFLVVDEEDAALERRDMASVWVRSRPASDSRDWVAGTLRSRDCAVAAAATPSGEVVLGDRGGHWLRLAAAEQALPPAVVAAAVAAWSRSGGSPEAWSTGIRVCAGGTETLVRATPPPPLNSGDGGDPEAPPHTGDEALTHPRRSAAGPPRPPGASGGRRTDPGPDAGTRHASRAPRAARRGRRAPAAPAPPERGTRPH